MLDRFGENNVVTAVHKTECVALTPPFKFRNICPDCTAQRPERWLPIPLSILEEEKHGLELTVHRKLGGHTLSLTPQFTEESGDSECQGDTGLGISTYHVREVTRLGPSSQVVCVQETCAGSSPPEQGRS